MILKRGSVVVHTVSNTWGSGKVIAIADFNTTILFSDGITRKIASSHYANLEPADPSTFVATAAEPTKVKAKAAPRKKKLPAAVVVAPI